MNYFTLITDTNKIAKTLVLFAFLLLSNISVFGQTQTDNKVVNAIDTNVVRKEDTNSTSTSINFVLWFMGSKQDPNTSTITSDRTNTKKQIMTSGMAPNRLLIKAFLKKAVDFESSLA
nr:hypothetical protein [uncultured Flavobacterium sp.]